MDQECHIGGIAVDVLAHGVRFPLQTYAPNEYDNGSFYSGLLAALAFTVLGRSVLALKLVTHLAAAAGAVAAWWLLRGCLDELRLTDRRARGAAYAALVLALAFAPRPVTLFSTYAVGNHAEGSAIDTILLALFARRLHAGSAPRTAVLWALIGGALYLNKGTMLVLPVLAAAQLWLDRAAPRRLLAAAAGFLAGILPELRIVALQQQFGPGMIGWSTIAAKEHRNANAFPRALLASLWFLGEARVGLLAAWAASLAAGIVGVRRGVRRAGAPPLTLLLVLAVSLLHLAILSVMAKSGLDAYVIYGYPTLVVLYGVLAAALVSEAARRWGSRAGRWAAVAAVALTAVLYRPDALSWGGPRVAALWHDRIGAACSWRFAEGFVREFDLGLAAGAPSRDAHALARCRMLSEPAQVLDCIGGIARELEWRQREASVAGGPPAELTAPERLAYAYWYGTHRKGDATACREFADPQLATTCADAVRLECLHYADLYTKLSSGQPLARPHCPLAAPPGESYWASRRRDLLQRTDGSPPNVSRAWGDDDLRNCQSTFAACY